MTAPATIAAARRYCELMGLDPDGYASEAAMTLNWQYYYDFASDKIRDAAMVKAIKEVMKDE